MREDQRAALRSRYEFRCGYCGVSERDAGAELTVDHFQPRSQGGRHEPENWVYCCHACNEFKGDYWQPSSTRRLLHPLEDDLKVHMIEQEDGTLKALGTAAEFHIERLRLNRPQLVVYRRELRQLRTARQEQARLLEHLKQLEEQVQSLSDRLQQLEDGGQNS